MLLSYYAWFPPFRCRSAVAVSPLPLREFRKNYVSAVRITLLAWKKNSLRRCRFHLPLRRNCRSVANRIESYFLPFCRWWTTNERFWSLHPYVYGKTFPAFPFSPATAMVATERKNGNGTTERHNGTTERRNGNGKTAMEWWKLGITPRALRSERGVCEISVRMNIVLCSCH